MSQRGSATLLTVALLSTLVMVAAGMAGVSRLVVAHVQATVAADAAALAAAPLTFLGGHPAREAATHAAVNGATLVSCRCSADPRPVIRTVTVEVVSHIELPVFGRIPVRARAAAEFDPLRLLGGEG
ncbi:hypothetical protein BH23ACT5_BH23ACT5_05510 [soil metagenome]